MHPGNAFDAAFFREYPDFSAVDGHYGVIAKHIALGGSHLPLHAVVDALAEVLGIVAVVSAVDTYFANGNLRACGSGQLHIAELAAQGHVGRGQFHPLDRLAGGEIAAKYHAFGIVAPLDRKVCVHHFNIQEAVGKLVAFLGHEAVPQSVGLVIQQLRLFHGHTGHHIVDGNGHSDHFALQHRHAQLVDLHTQSRVVYRQAHPVDLLQQAVAEVGLAGAVRLHLHVCVPLIFRVNIRPIGDLKAGVGLHGHFQEIDLAVLEAGDRLLGLIDPASAGDLEVSGNRLHLDSGSSAQVDLLRQRGKLQTVHLLPAAVHLEDDGEDGSVLVCVVGGVGAGAGPGDGQILTEHKALVGVNHRGHIVCLVLLEHGVLGHFAGLAGPAIHPTHIAGHDQDVGSLGDGSAGLQTRQDELQPVDDGSAGVGGVFQLVKLQLCVIGVCEGLHGQHGHEAQHHRNDQDDTHYFFHAMYLALQSIFAICNHF